MELRKNGSPPNSPYTTLDYNSPSNAIGLYKDIRTKIKPIVPKRSDIKDSVLKPLVSLI